MKPLKNMARGVLRALPDEGKSIKTTVRKMLVHKQLVVGKLAQRLAGATLPDPRTVFHIDPRRIEYATSRQNGSADPEDWVLEQKGNTKPVQPGDWDALHVRVADMRVVAAVQARVATGADWVSTSYYKTAVQQIEAGRPLWNCNTRADFDAHCGRVDALIESIRRDGYKVGATAGGGFRMDTAAGQSEILVNIGRDGLPLFQDGRHRLAIALALGLPTIPVQVFVRHTEWQTFREYLLRIARSEGGTSKAGMLYQRAAHFDLADIPAEHGCEDRWNAIEPHLPARDDGRAMDIGCNLGFICHRLEDRGFSPVGVEYLPDIAYAARRIAKAEGRAFEVVIGDVLDPATLAGVGSQFDVVMALNIFHHFIKTEGGYGRLRALLGRLRIGTMFFEPHQPDDPQMQGMFANPTPEEFATLVRDWAGLTKMQEIYRAEDGRVVFLLQR